MDIYILSQSTNPKKKFMVKYINNNTKKIRTIHFGAKNYSDFLQHQDLSRVHKYDARHKKNEDWTNPHKAGFWAKWILWNPYANNIDEAIRQIENSFNIKIIKN